MLHLEPQESGQTPTIVAHGRPPRRLARYSKVFDLAPWVSVDERSRAFGAVVLELISFERMANDLICAAVEALRWVCSAKSFLRVDQAKHMQACRMLARSGIAALGPLRTCFGELRLMRSYALVAQWYSNNNNKKMAALGDRMVEILISGQCQKLLANSQALDCTCPRWGPFFGEDCLQLELARLQLVQNKAINSRSNSRRCPTLPRPRTLATSSSTTSHETQCVSAKNRSPSRRGR